MTSSVISMFFRLMALRRIGRQEGLERAKRQRVHEDPHVRMRAPGLAPFEALAQRREDVGRAARRRPR